MADVDWVGRVGGLRQWASGPERAPHKPLLLLYALGRFQAAPESGLRYTDVEEDLAGRPVAAPEEAGAAPVAAPYARWHTTQVFRGWAGGQRAGSGGSAAAPHSPMARSTSPGAMTRQVRGARTRLRAPRNAGPAAVWRRCRWIRPRSRPSTPTSSCSSR